MELYTIEGEKSIEEKIGYIYQSHRDFAENDEKWITQHNNIENNTKSIIEDISIIKKNTVNVEKMLEKSTNILDNYEKINTKNATIEAYFNGVVRIIWNFFWIALIAFFITLFTSIVLFNKYYYDRGNIKEFIKTFSSIDNRKSKENSEPIEYDYITSNNGRSQMAIPRSKIKLGYSKELEKTIVHDSSLSNKNKLYGKLNDVSPIETQTIPIDTVK